MGDYCTCRCRFDAAGDLWSYNTERDVFIVSPEPDVSAYTLDVQQTGCIVLASDGLWNMVRPQEAVDLVDYVTENVSLYL